MSYHLNLGTAILDFINHHTSKVTTKPKYVNFLYAIYDDVILQLLMLSFCRGGIRPAFNRVTQGFESRELPDLVNTPSFSPVKQKLPSKQRFKEYQTHPFPGVEVPPDCYVLFTTLPDSK